MKNNLLKIKSEDSTNNFEIIRVLELKTEKALIISCTKKSMPKWVLIKNLVEYIPCTINELLEITNINLFDLESSDIETKKIAHERYTMIAGILPFISNEKQRSKIISMISEQTKTSKQTLRNYLCLYLIYQDLSVLAPKKKDKKPLTKDEKNMRWALNKFFYTKNKNSLNTAYTLMLKEKYCDSNGILFDKYPSFYQFRYFYRNNKNMQTYYISRNGLKDYQMNNRPLLGDGIQQFASTIGTGMLDSTICDIYLINEAGDLIGRPILTACIDTYSSLCCGYSLSWEGGIYSVNNLILNIISDKVEWCNKFGIKIKPDEWDCHELPSTFVTDMGSEYKSENFEQITELGVKVINLPPYRPELKGGVEKFFDLVQTSYKKHLKGKGVIEPDFKKRGSHDYRKDACLTIKDFEKIILHCIIYYNNKRIIKGFPYTEEMIKSNIKPYANNIWNWGKTQLGANLISVDIKQIVLTLLPRTTGEFTRYGLKVNKLRYHNDDYNMKYLEGGKVTVAYSPDNVSNIWVVDNGSYIKFNLIESRFENKNIEEVYSIKTEQNKIINSVIQDNLQAQIDLAKHIETISNKTKHKNTSVKSIRKNRKKESNKSHIDILKDGELYD